MSDLLMLVLVVAAFGVAAIYAQFCDAVARRPASTGETER